MTGTIRMAGVFSGIGGFEEAARRNGVEVASVTEVNKHCLKVLAEQFPTARQNGDICGTSASDLGDGLDLFTGGFPCENTSIAAPHREGLAGSQSCLYYEFIRLLNEYLRLVEAARPRWVVLENPEGLLVSNKGRDMAAVVAGLGDLGYGFAYRVVDGRYLGSTQRRRRVLVVGHLGGDPIPALAVLGDTGAGSETGATSRFGADRPTGPRAVGSGAEGHVWRKSARPRAALSKGGYETWVADGRGNTLTKNDVGNATRQTHLLVQDGRLRTLTRHEWERMQGFPDTWCDSMTDGAAFAALGNALHVGTGDWLMRRLVAVHEAMPLLSVA